MSNISLASVGN